MTKKRENCFPESHFTPYGYLDNKEDGGPLSGFDKDGPVVVHPFMLSWEKTSELSASRTQVTRIGFKIKGQCLFSDEDFISNGIEVASDYHSKNIIRQNFQFKEIDVSAAYFLSSGDTVLCEIESSEEIEIYVTGSAGCQKKTWDSSTAYANENGLKAAASSPWYTWKANKKAAAFGLNDDEDHLYLDLFEGLNYTAYLAQHSYGKEHLQLYGTLQYKASTLTVAVSKAKTVQESGKLAEQALAQSKYVYKQLLDEDNAFWEKAPQLTGDFPDYWKNSFVYDLETTRMCVREPIGIFKDVWPTWRTTDSLRLVLAEGALDMMRLHYVDQDKAERAILEMFESAPVPNVPNIFPNGVFDTGADNGEPTGTAPSWCFPFHCIYTVYLRSLNKRWLEKVFPHMANYLNWWHSNRTDSDGYAVYLCTWECGEDENPRLDPERKGNRVIREEFRPVELQAAMAHSAGILVNLAEEIGLPAAEWQELQDHYVKKTKSLYDRESGRFRDFDTRYGDWIKRNMLYNGVNVDEGWAQHLATALYQVAGEEEKVSLIRDFQKLSDQSFYKEWGSLAFAIAESGQELGIYKETGDFVYGIIDRVYEENDRRTIKGFPPNTPGVAHENWPFDKGGELLMGSDCYGWGAVTAQLVIRQLIGFLESVRTDGVEFILAPCIDENISKFGKQFGIRNLNYRGETIDIQYELKESFIEVTLDFGESKTVRVNGQFLDAHSTTFNLSFYERAVIRIM